MIRLLLFLLFVSSPGLAVAHGGEDHGLVAPPSEQGEAGRSAFAQSEQFELVLRWPTADAHEALPVRALLSDWASNAPVDDAAIELTFVGRERTSAKASEVAPGVYEASVSLPSNGRYAVGATIVVDDRADALAFGSFEAGPMAIDAHEEAAPRGLFALLGIGALAIVLVGLGLVVRRRRALLALLFVAPSSALAHGGEAHEVQKAPTVVPSGAASHVTLAKESQFLLRIRTERVAARGLRARTSVAGRVVAPPERQASIHASQAGRLVPGTRLPRLGARVRKGELLAELEAVLSASDRADFATRGALAGGQIEAARARVEAARKSAARLRALSGVVSQQEREAAEVEQRAAEAELAGARAASTAYGKGGSTRLALRSPIDGVVADVQLSPGSLVEPGTRLFLIVDRRELWIEAAVFEIDLGKLHATTGALVRVESHPEKTFEATLLAMGQVVDPSTRTVKCVFRVEDPEGLLRIGMFAQVELGVGDEARALAIPERAVIDQEGRQIVYVHVEPEVFEARELALGRRDGTYVEVLQGLGAGERVVVEGAPSLRGVAPRVR